jgi:dihydrofolate reductase
VSSERTRIERSFDVWAIRELKETSDADLAIGGAELGGLAISAGLVDDIHMFLAPVIVGGGKRALPDHVRAQLEFVEQRRFDNGFAYLHYRFV